MKLRSLPLALLVTLVMSWGAIAAPPSLAAPAAPAVVLINQPASSVCVGRAFTVGVWFQQFSGGSRAFRVAIYGPRHTRFFYRHGLAPSTGWKFWQIRTGRRGKYRTVYFGHRPGSAKWTSYEAITRARRCRG
jgi:hypothetical protein